jgi:hypothetical protein
MAYGTNQEIFSFTLVRYAISYTLLLRRCLMALVLLACSTAGCAGMDWPQQVRLERGESPGLLRIQTRETFFASRFFTLHQEGGAVTVHAISRSGSGASGVPLNDFLTDEALAHVNETLIPFLVPSCEAPLPQ